MLNEEKKDSKEKKVDPEMKRAKRKILIAVFFLIVGVGSLTYGLAKAIIKQPGWREVTAESTNESCANDFVFYYNIGYNGATASVEYNELKRLYTDAIVKSFRIFHNDKSFSGVHNVKYINEHPGEEIKVDHTLYHAFEQVEKSGLRNLYLGSVYDSYDQIFFAETDEEAYLFDPIANEEVKQKYQKLCAFAKDDKSVKLELLGNDKVKLFVSKAYQEYAKSVDVHSYIDFNWMKNAFIVDYVADIMRKGNHTAGYIASCDGFTNNFDSTHSDFDMTFYDRDGSQYYEAGKLQYKGARSIIYLHNYSMSVQDKYQYYETKKTKEIRTPYLSVEDGICRSCKNDLIMTGKKSGCVDLLMNMIPVYIADELDKAAIDNLSKDGICTIYCENHKIICNDQTVTFDNLYDRDGITYEEERK
ncbi:hypothetical protein SAMN02910358_00545 [Lachnospiraceae bacterium XBB1006]|nr:hypothetical protein SAMN02910358_00545 [Lachnospiraceae bacterium XBB1006]